MCCGVCVCVACVPTPIIGLRVRVRVSEVGRDWQVKRHQLIIVGDKHDMT